LDFGVILDCRHIDLIRIKARFAGMV